MSKLNQNTTDLQDILEVANSISTEVNVQTNLIEQIMMALEDKAVGSDLTPIVDALTEKGVTVPAGTNVDGLAALIAASGGSAYPFSNIMAGTYTTAVNTDKIDIGSLIGKVPPSNKKWFFTIFLYENTNTHPAYRITQMHYYNYNYQTTYGGGIYKMYMTSSDNTGSVRNVYGYDGGIIQLAMDNMGYLVQGYGYVWLYGESK